MLHEAWGLTPDIRDACARLSDHGYVTLAPDLTGGMYGPGGAVAQIVAGRGPLLTRALDAIERLIGHPEVTQSRIGVVGFSMGAALASLLDRHPSTDVIGFNYGMVPPAALSYRSVPVVASFGDADLMLPRQDRPLLRRLRKRAVPHDVVVYEGAGHSFMTNPIGHEGVLARGLLRIGQGAGVAEHAWSRLLTFLDRHLGEP